MLLKILDEVKQHAAEQRLTIDKAGEDTRATQRVVGQERRAEIGETGLQYRRGLETAGEQDRADKRDLRNKEQQSMFRRYKENRDLRAGTEPI